MNVNVKLGAKKYWRR